MKVVPVIVNGETVNIKAFEMPPVWYDSIYAQEKMYGLPACESLYYPIYEKICARIGEDERVVDLGCGTGQLAQALANTGKKFVMGVDFSPVAIEKARSMMPTGNFVLGELYNPAIYGMVQYDCVVLCEVMEHLEYDLAILGHIREGSHVLFTVPNYIAWAIVEGTKVASHIRGFLDEASIIKRYGHVLEIGGMEAVVVDRKMNWKVWVVDSRRRFENAVD